MSYKDDIQLPTWFRMMKRIATELSLGFIAAYIILQNLHINKDMYEIINISIISLGLPCVVLSCSNAIEFIKNIRSNGS